MCFWQTCTHSCVLYEQKKSFPQRLRSQKTCYLQGINRRTKLYDAPPMIDRDYTAFFHSYDRLNSTQLNPIQFGPIRFNSVRKFAALTLRTTNRINYWAILPFGRNEILRIQNSGVLMWFSYEMFSWDMYCLFDMFFSLSGIC